MIVNQWVPAAHRGDAIGDSARRVRELLRRMGHRSDLYALSLDDDFAGDAKLFQEAREAEPERLRAHQVDLFFEQPTRVIFAKARWFHHRLRFKCVGIGGEFGLRLGEQDGPHE